MLVTMYWEDNEDEKRKFQREEKLRQKKGLPPLPPPPIPVVEEINEPEESEPTAEKDPNLDRVLALLERQMQITEQQSKQLSGLNAYLEEQKKILDKVLAKEEVRVVTVSTEASTVVAEEKVSPKFKKLDDVDVNCISTDGIESVGEAGGEIVKGKSITSQIDKLRKLKNKK